MGYLLPAEYAEFGLTDETADAWVTASSAMMEAYCRRPTLLRASYTERMRVPRAAQTETFIFFRGSSRGGTIRGLELLG